MSILNVRGQLSLLGSRRSIQTVAMLAAAVSPLVGGSSQAATYNFTPSTAGTYLWGDSANWDAPPGSGAATILNFGDGLTGAGAINANNNLGPFQLNQLNILYSGSPTFVIGGAAGNALEFVANGSAGPVINNAIAATITTGLTGSANLTKTGAGTLTLSTLASTNTGTTTIARGQLSLSFNVSGGPTTHLLGATSSLVLGNGDPLAVPALSVGGRNAAVANVQSFAATQFNTGRSTITATKASNAGNTVTVNLGSLSRQAGALGTLSLANAGATFNTTTANEAGGILGGWLTSGTTFAANDGTGKIVAYSGHVTSGATIADAPTSNVQVTNSTAGAVSLSGAGTTHLSTLSIPDTAAGREVIIGAGNTLRLGPTGAIWRNVASGTLTTFAVTGGNLTAGGTDDTAGDLILRADGAVSITGGSGAQLFSSISSNIVNNGTGAVSVTKAGAQAITISGTNTYSGPTHVLEGTLHSTVSQGFGLAGDVSVTNGAQAYAGGATYSNDFYIIGNGPNAAFGSISVMAGALRLGLGSTVSGDVTLLGDSRIASITTKDHSPGPGIGGTITGKVTGTGNLSIGASGQMPSNVTFSNPGNDYVGDTTLTLGGTSSGANLSILNLGASEVIPNGVGKGNLVMTYTGNQVTAVALNGFDETINGLLAPTLSSSDASRVIRNSSPTPATFTFGDNNAGGTFFGQFQNGVLPGTSTAAAALSVVKIGSGTQILGGRTSHTGSTTIQDGRVVIDFNRIGTSLTSNPANYFSVNSDVVLSGGTLEIQERADGAASSQGATYGNTTAITLPSTEGLVVGQGVTGTNIPANAYIVLINGNVITLNAAATNGPTAGPGTINTVATSGGASQTFKSLTVAASSTLDFGAGDATIIQFGSVAQTLNGAVLTIENWNGAPDTFGGAERLLFTGDASSFTALFQQSEVFFGGVGAGYAIQQFAGFYEVSATTVPEPALATVALLGAGLVLRRRRA